MGVIDIKPYANKNTNTNTNSSNSNKGASFADGNLLFSSRYRVSFLSLSLPGVQGIRFSNRGL
jgi:hypothetical protein